MAEKSVVESMVKALEPFLDQTLIDEGLLAQLKEQALIMEKQGKIEFAYRAYLQHIGSGKDFISVVDEMSNV